MANKKGQFFPTGDENPSSSTPIITYAIIGLCAIIFIWSLTDFDNIINNYGFTPANFVILTLFTSMFLHGGIDHIFGNMWFLFIFGDNVEDKFGKIGYIIFYIASGIAAALVQYITDPLSNVPTIGASGAISGVLGAYLVFYPHVRVRVISGFFSSTVPAFIMIGLWFVIQLIMGTVSLTGGPVSNIAFWAHVGGFVFGAITALVVKMFSRS